MYGTWMKPRHTAVRILNCIFCVREPLVPKSNNILPFFCLNEFGIINFESQESEFPMVFNMFVNMFWIAEGFGYMGVLFKFWLVNNLCWILSLQ